MAAESESLNSKSLLRLYKQNMMLKVMDIKSDEPRLTRKRISKQLRYCDSTIKRHRADNFMENPYNGGKYRKKPSKSNTSISQTQTHSPSEKIKNNKNNK